LLTEARYTYSVSFSALIVAAMNLAEYWNISTMWKSICYVFIPIALGAINSRQVQVREGQEDPLMKCLMLRLTIILQGLRNH